jgi:hypothetical protein
MQNERPLGEDAARQISATFGALSAASAVAMLMMPTAMAALYGLPRSRVLVLALGARDLTIGIALLAAEEPALFLWGRAVSDAFDAMIIMVEARHRQPVMTALRIAIAMGSAVLAAKTGRTLARPSR